MARTVKKSKDLAAGQPTKPNNLSPRAAVEWDRLAKELTDSHIQITPAHRVFMSMAATIQADIADAWAAVETDGAYIAGKAGIVAHPASKRLDALRRDLQKALTMLGLRTAVAGTDEPERTLEDELGL